MNMTNDQWREALNAICEKASHDHDFLTQCQSDPATAFRETTGLDFPEDMRVEFIEALALLKSGELSEEHLDQVAGGNMPVKNTKPPWENP